MCFEDELIFDIVSLIIVKLVDCLECCFVDRTNCCCDCETLQTKLKRPNVMLMIRYWIHLFSTAGPLAIILIKHDKSLFSPPINVPLVCLIGSFVACGVFMLIVLQCCKTFSNNFKFSKIIFIFSISMLITDILMCVFTATLDRQEDENFKFVDYSNFQDGFVTTIFFISLFDILHAFVSTMVLMAKLIKGSDTVV